MSPQPGSTRITATKVCSHLASGPNLYWFHIVLHERRESPRGSAPRQHWIPQGVPRKEIRANIVCIQPLSLCTGGTLANAPPNYIQLLQSFRLLTDEAMLNHRPERVLTSHKMD